MARAQGARAQLAAAFESIYGTAPASGYARLPFASANLSMAQTLLDNELLGFGRDPLAPELDTEDTDGDIVVPVDVEAFGLWLKATLGAPVTSGAGPYTHVYTSGGWTLPSLSIETGLPEVPHFAMAKGVKVDRLALSMQRKGHLQATASLIAQGEAVASSTQAGTPVPYALSRFVQRHGSITRGGAALGEVVSADLTYANNLDRIETIRADAKIDGLDPSMAMLSGRITVRFSSQTLLTQATDGDPAAFTFRFTKGGESLTLAVPQLYLPKPKVAVEGPQGIQVTFDWQAAQDTDGDPMLTATLVNAVESY